MKENESKPKRRFQWDSVSTYEEFADDGKKYYPQEELQMLNCILQSETKKGAIITGKKGLGKTSLVRSFVQQDLRSTLKVEDVKVIHLKRAFFMGVKNVDQIVNSLSDIVENLNSSQLVLYAEMENLDALKRFLNIWNIYSEELKNFYKLAYLKVIFEVTTESLEEYNQVIKLANNSYSCIDVPRPKDLGEFMSIIVLRANNLSEMYSVSYTRDVLFFYMVLLEGWATKIDRDNINYYVDGLETVFVFAKRKGNKTLERDIAEELYKESFKYLSETPQDALLNTAIHESGHVLLHLLNSKYAKIIYVSIVPTSEYNGVVHYVPNKMVPSMYRHKDYYLNVVAIKLGGKVAESVINNATYAPNSGASRDLNNANSLIRRMLYEFGFSDSLGENVVVPDGKEPFSEELKVKIEKEKRELLAQATVIAKKAILENAQFVESLADRLSKELIISGDEVYRMWEEYLSLND